MTEQMEQMIYNEGYRRGKADRHKILDDGTLVISVDDATAVTRVLVEDDKKNGDLYYVMSDDTFEWCHDCKEYDQENYCCHRWTKVIRNTVAELKADRPNGEWIYGEHDVAMCDGYRCDRCGFFVPWDYEHKSIDFIDDYNFCPNCGCDMRGEE